MIVKYRKRFLKELSKLPSKIRTQIEQFVFEDLPKLCRISELGSIEKMQGYDGFYKARFGQYRVGMYLKDNILILERVLHRKDIYRYFP